MKPTTWPVDPTHPMSACALQPGILLPCISHPRRMDGGGMTCYSGVTCLRWSRATQSSGSQWPLLTTTSDNREASRSQRRKPEEASRQGCRHVTCRHPVGVHSKRRVALPGLDHSVGSHGRDEAGRPQQDRRTFPADQQTGQAWQNTVGVCRQNSHRHA